MKSEFQVKFLQDLSPIFRKKQDDGFTLIELLVVVIIIGILAAIALPSFLNQANKAKESESKQYIGSMNRTQQAYFLEKNTFTTEVAQLGLGIKTDSTNYTYLIYSSDSSHVVNVAYPKNTTTLRAYTGGVQLAQTAQSEATTIAILCQSNRPSPGSPVGVAFASSISPGATLSCGANFDTLDK